jgi:hypothetical protein
LAAAGLLLTKKIATLVIPSSNDYDHPHAWGSHWETDPFWGRPQRFNIIHGTNAINRRDKIFKIAEENLVKDHLRVCWKNIDKTGNCSKCEKCLRTMVTLQASGRLAAYHRVFNTQTSLATLLDNLHAIPHNLRFVWDDLVTRNLPQSTRTAIQRLMQRSKMAHIEKQSQNSFRPFRMVINKIRKAF